MSHLEALVVPELLWLDSLSPGLGSRLRDTDSLWPWLLQAEGSARAPAALWFLGPLFSYPFDSQLLGVPGFSCDLKWELSASASIQMNLSL